jgi:type III secretion system FlhB-like substrate exporter
VTDFADTPVSALLELAASQLEVAAHTTDSQVETLAKSIAALVTLSVELQASSGTGTEQGGLASKIVEQAQSALVAMQFHDQLVQRMAHVRDALTELNEALNGAPAAEVDWATVLAGIRFRYSMEDERMQFDRIIGCAACPDMNTHDNTHDSLRGSVELF